MQIKDWIHSAMNTAGMDLQLIEQNTGVNMSYDFIKNFVGVDLNRVQEAWHELAFFVPLETYIKVMTLHELGHAADREALLDSLPRTMEIYKMKRSVPLKEQYSNPELLAMRIEEHEMNIAFEKTAWHNAEEMNRSAGFPPPSVFAQIKAHSLKSYLRNYEKDLRLYKELPIREIEQTA